jgi:hypothetical protein
MPKPTTELQKINKTIEELAKKLEITAKTEPSIALFVYLDLIKAMIERVSLENMQLYSYLDKKMEKITDKSIKRDYEKIKLGFMRSDYTKMSQYLIEIWDFDNEEIYSKKTIQGLGGLNINKPKSKGFWDKIGTIINPVSSVSRNN